MGNKIKRMQVTTCKFNIMYQAACSTFWQNKKTRYCYINRNNYGGKTWINMIT